MLNIGGGELLVILLVALIFLGPTRLPEVARQLGQTVSALRSIATGFQAELEAASRPDMYLGEKPKSDDPGREPLDAEPGDTEHGADAGVRAGAADTETDTVAEPETGEQPTDPADIGRVARLMNGHGSNEPRPVSEGGPTDLRPRPDERDIDAVTAGGADDAAPADDE